MNDETDDAPRRSRAYVPPPQRQLLHDLAFEEAREDRRHHQAPPPGDPAVTPSVAAAIARGLPMRCDRCAGNHPTHQHPTQLRPDLIAAAPHVREQVRRRIEGDHR